MVRHTDDPTPRLAFRLSCRKCRQDFVQVFDDAEAYRNADVLACPSCMGTETYDDGIERARDFPDGYDVVDRKITDVAYVDAFDDFDDLPDADVTPTQAADYFAVEVDGKTGGERARERGVVRGTVSNSVARARRKVRGDA